MSARRSSQHQASPHAEVDETPSSAECADALRRLTVAAERLRLITAQHLGLSLVDSLAVSHLVTEGPQEQHQLAARLTMTSGTITAMIDRLVARSLVERTPHESDRRKTVVTLTDSGRDRLAEASGWTTEAFQHLDPDTYPTAVRILDAITAGLVASGDTITARTDADTNPSRLR